MTSKQKRDMNKIAASARGGGGEKNSQKIFSPPPPPLGVPPEKRGTVLVRFFFVSRTFSVYMT